MLKSMTGFGKAVASLPEKKITVEVRSLNSKQLDLSVKLPTAYRPLEYELRAAAARVLQRGKADLLLSLESTGSATVSSLDEERFRAFYARLRSLCSDLSVDDNTLVGSILRMPEVMGSGEVSIGEEEHATILHAVSQALDALDAFRRREGKVLVADLLARVGTIEELLSQVTPFEEARIGAVRKRILDQLATLSVAPDSGRLEQELVFYIERLDITEEKVRLANHCRYFREVAAGEEGAGRKLGFIAQEMGREINTMGSKAGDASIQRIVVEMKDELEKIKEQVLNIL